MAPFSDLEWQFCWLLLRSKLIFFAVITISSIWIFRRTLRIKTSNTLPVARTVGIPQTGFAKWTRARLNYIKNGYNIIFDGYRSYPDSFFCLPAEQKVLVVPPRYIDELKSQPKSILDPTDAVADYFLGRIITLDVTLSGRTIFDATRKHLQQQLHLQAAPLLDECSFALNHELRNLQDQSVITLHPFILQMITRMNARIFVGKKLCRDARWLHISSDFSTCIFFGAGTLKMFPSFMKPAIAYLNPYIRRIHQHRQLSRELLAPEIQRRNAESSDQKKSHQDMLQWIMEMPEGEKVGLERIVDQELGLGFAATHGTTNLIVNAIYDLAARWNEYAAELREEVDAAFEGGERSVSGSVYSNLSKLDSFIRESQRMNPGSALSFHRKVKAPHKLSDGTLLQPSTYLAMASGPLAMSEAYYSNATTFDGFRFHRSRQDGSGQHQFGSTGVSSLVFGHGRYACPGRMFAGLEAKILMAQVLRFYDLSLEAGSSRPQNSIFADANLPDQKTVVYFRKRESS